MEDKKMKFLWTSIYVNNLEESIAFYTELLDIKVLRRFIAGSGKEIAFLGNGDTDETLVELLVDSNNKEVTHSNYISIGFAVESVDAMLDIVKSKNIPVNSGPIENPGSKFFTVKDPNGLSIQFFQGK
jgi:lactoylglutathione lyase